MRCIAAKIIKNVEDYCKTNNSADEALLENY